MGRLKIDDVSTNHELFAMDPKQMGQAAVRAVLREKVGEEFTQWGRDLNTVDKARAWLTDPRNWFEERTHIIKWDGIVPKVSSLHGRRLIQEYWDDGLAVVVVVGQRNIRNGQKEKEEIPSAE